MIEILKHLLTGQDNETHDIVHWLAFVACLAGIGLTIFTVVVKGQAFDLQQYGIGIGVLLGGLGAALKLKEKVEP